MLSSRTVKLAAFVARCLCATVLVVALGSIANGQSALPPGSRAYPLLHRKASDVAVQLRTVLSGIDGAANVFVDQELNRLVVKGSAEAQQVAAQLVGNLDQPTTAAKNAQPAAVARAYRTSDRDPRQVAQALRVQFPNIRVEPDLRTGQVVALAPEAKQRQIAAVLGAPIGRPADAAQQAVPQQALAQRGYQLQNTTWQEFETELRKMCGPRLALSTTPTGEVATIALATATGPRTVMQIDRRTNLVTFDRDGRQAHVWAQVVQAIDLSRGSDERAQLVSLQDADPAKVQRAVTLLQATAQLAAAADGQNATATDQLGGGNRARWGGNLVANLFQPEAQAGDDQGQPAAGQPPAADNAPGEAVAGDAGEGAGLIGPVQIEFLEGMDAIMIRGHKRDVERVRKIIEDIERLSKETQPLVEVYPLEFVNSEAVTTLVLELYEEILSPRQGQVSIRALVEPNAILLIGREESVTVVKDLIEKLDRPMVPSSRFEVLRLKHVSAVDAEAAVRNFFVNRPGTDTEVRPGLGTRVQVIADYRTNTLIVQASPRDLGEVKRLIESIDVEDSASTAQVRVFKLRNSIAEELAEVLQSAIAGDVEQTGQQQQQGGQTQAGSRLPSTAIEFMMLDEAGGRLLRSGVVSDVQVSADPNTNALIVRAPAKSMELIEALIKELDQMPDAEAQLKVFTILNGDATMLAATLQQVFGQDVTIGQGSGGALGIAFRQPQVQTTTTGGEGSLVPLTFAVDLRTNSVIASGSASDLEVVETLLLRLDEEGFTSNQVIVYRLKNNSSDSVALAVSNYIADQSAALNQTVLSGLSTTLDQLILQISVISEPVSNSVIVAASPRYMDSIMEAIRELDVRPPMVLVQCLIAEVFLGDVHEFGVELGLQDDLLYDRGFAGGTANTPGFNFNGVGLPNSTPASPGTVGSQGISDLGLGRTASLLGAGSPGLVLSAASDSVNILVRALEEEGRLQVLSRPQVMALNNQPAFVQVGKDVARSNGTTATNTGVSQSIQDVPTGLILSIQPRINDDGVVVMTVDADKSEQGSAADGTTFSDGSGGTFVVPPINRTTAQTTISAKSGQTVVIGGLITKRDELRSTGVPFLRDIPIAGHLFNFEASETIRTELLIILTPYIVSDDEDYEMIKMMESQRMNWCLGDVVSLDGERGLQGAGCLFCSDDVPVLFPDSDPTGTLFAAGEQGHSNGHTHEQPHRVHQQLQPTPAVSPNEQVQGLEISGLEQQPNLQSMPQQTINAGYNQFGQYGGQPTDSRYGATPAAYVPSQQPVSQPQPNQQPRISFKPSWFPFRRK